MFINSVLGVLTIKFVKMVLNVSRLVVVILLLHISIVSGKCQSLGHEKNKVRKEIGFMAQFYPAGIIPTFLYEKTNLKNTSYLLRLGANITNRKDYSPFNDNETGHGFGASFGCRKYINYKRISCFGGVNLDQWNMWINWKDDMGKINESKGKSYTFVVQPWVEIGCYVMNKTEKYRLGISTGFGREINIITKGENVGQGWMNSAALYVNYRLTD